MIWIKSKSAEITKPRRKHQTTSWRIGNRVGLKPTPTGNDAIVGAGFKPARAYAVAPIFAAIFFSQSAAIMKPASSRQWASVMAMISSLDWDRSNGCP